MKAEVPWQEAERPDQLLRAWYLRERGEAPRFPEASRRHRVSRWAKQTTWCLGKSPRQGSQRLLTWPPALCEA